MFSSLAPLLILITIVVIYAIIRLRRERSRSRVLALSLGLILGGAVGNLIDRLAYGYVIDFLDLEVINWPVFNVADIAITVGVVLLIYYVYVVQHRVREAERQ